MKLMKFLYGKEPNKDTASKSLTSSFQSWGQIDDKPVPIVIKSTKEKKMLISWKFCKRKKSSWEPKPQANVFKSDEVADSKDPKVFRVLDYKFWDGLFICACLSSIFLFTFCEGFLIQSRLMWALIHGCNAVYTVLLLLQWTKVIMRMKVSQNSFTRVDVIFSLLSILPVDLIVLLIHSMNQGDPEANASNQESHLTFTFSRLHYVFRIKHILNYLAGWENQLILGDFYSFLLRILLYTTLLIHTFACIWHRVACNSFRPKHYLMDPYKAREDICKPGSWIMRLAHKSQAMNSTHYTPFLRSSGSHKSILWDHYAASLYWSTGTMFRLGYGDFDINMVSNSELVTQTLAQIVSWIFVLAFVCGTLTSLLIESDTERESYLTRRFAIRHYLNFSRVGRSVVHEVKKFYDYLWSKRKGVSELNLVEFMPAALKAEIFFDIHKFVLEQMPLFQDLDASFLMTLSVRMTHSFHLTGETLFHRNERGNHMYYVLKGHLEIMSADDSHPIACIRSGSAIGDIFLVHPYSHACTVRCGSECDILALTRENVNEVLKDYSQYSDILQRRIQERFEQSVLLLGLAKKYNEAPKLFEKLPFEMPSAEVVQVAPLTEVAEEAPPKANQEETDNEEEEGSSDPDGLSLTTTVLSKLSSLVQNAIAKKEKKMDKRRRSVQEEAFSALASDVNRTHLLAKDLGISRAPLTIAPPVTILARDSKDNMISGDNESLFMKLKHVPIMNGEERSTIYLCWKFFVSVCTCIILFYFPYQLAFRDGRASKNLKLDGFVHITDFVFAMDCLIDMLQIVVTPQKTLETVGDIMSFRIRSLRFYARIVAFLPLEYVVAPAVDMEYADSAYYYLLKSNRYLQVIVLKQFFQDLEGCTKIPIIAVFLSKYLLTVFYVIHFFAVSYEFILRDFISGTLHNTASHLHGDQSIGPTEYRRYGFVLYWSTQIVTTAGFGDIPYYYTVEVLLLCCAFISGTIVTTYLGAKLAAILANAQRRRISFKQTYYGVKAFLKHRKFPEDLARRIKSYYRMQWKAHEGVLTPKERSAIWDAPEAIVSEVALAQAFKYMSRVPLVKHTSENVLKNMCTALKQYFVPPDECVSFEGDKRRELYIIVKGFCNVYCGSQFVGNLSEGNYFGLSGLIMGVNLNYRITTATHCLFFCLQFDDFVEIAKKHKFLRKDYRLLRGESPFEKLEDLVGDTGKKTRKSDFSCQSETVEKELEHVASEICSANVSFQPTSSICSRVLRYFLLRQTFLPGGRLMSCWATLRVIAGALVSYYVVAQVAFAFDPHLSFITILAFDIIAWIDMYLMLHVAYHNEFNQLVMDPVKTAFNYVTGPFLFDLACAFPFEWIVILCNPRVHVFSGNFDYAHKYKIITLLRLNRFFQLYKLVQLGQILNQTISTSLTFMTLLEVMPWMLVMLHIFACCSVAAVCYVTDNGEAFECSSSAWLVHGTIFEDNSGNMTDDGPPLQEPFKLYVISFYWTIVAALRVGFGDIDLLNMENRAIAIGVILSGTIVTTYLSSKLTACMVGEDSRRIEIRTKIDIMYSFLDRYKASRAVKRRVKEIYFNEWDKTKGISVDQLFVALHPSLKADVMSHLYEESIRQQPLLKHLDEPGIRMLASILKEVFLVEGEYIFKYGNITDDVFLVASGIVAAYNVKGEVMSYMGAGSLLGEMSAMYGVTRLYTAVAATDVDVLVFSAEDFLDFLELYPTLKDRLEQLCENMGQGQVGYIGQPVDVLSVSANEPHQSARIDHIISTSSPKQRVRKNVVRAQQKQGGETPSGGATGPRSNRSDPSRNPMCILDPLRVPLKHGQLSDKDKELMLQDSNSEKKWWSAFITFGRVPKTEMGALLHIFQDKKRCNFLNFTIHPASPITRGSGWCVFNLLITAISCALTAYEISFTSKNVGESWYIAVLRYSAELFFVARIFGNFHLGYVDDAGVLVTDVKKISKRYCTRFDGFILDMTTTLPIYAVSYMMGGDNKSVRAANIRGIQLLRVVLFVRYLGETDNDLRMKASEVKILKIIILLCFIFHFCACAWYLVACYGMSCDNRSWMKFFLNKLLEAGAIQSESDISIASRYWLSLSYVTTTITSTGFSFVTPRTVPELISTICFIFGTIFVIGYLLGEMTQCLASQISRKIHYEHELSVVESHLAGLGLNKSKRDIVADYYKLVWRRFRGMPYFALLKELPYPLRADIAFEIYEPNIKNARVLGTIDDQVLRQITARIRHEFYLPGGHIVRGGNVCDAMYFVKHGEILIIDENMGIELVVDTLYQNDCFGEMKILLPREAYRFSYVARVESEVGMLKRDDLDEVLKNFPGLRTELMEKIRHLKYNRHTGKDDVRYSREREREDNKKNSENKKEKEALIISSEVKEERPASIAHIEIISPQNAPPPNYPNYDRKHMEILLKRQGPQDERRFMSQSSISSPPVPGQQPKKPAKPPGQKSGLKGVTSAGTTSPGMSRAPAKPAGQRAPQTSAPATRTSSPPAAPAQAQPRPNNNKPSPKKETATMPAGSSSAQPPPPQGPQGKSPVVKKPTQQSSGPKKK